jgi:hypothetical protein
MELEVTWKRTIRVWWAYFWRNLFAIVAAMMCGMVVGFIIGVIMGLMGAPIWAVQLVVAPLGFLIGLAISVVPVKMILGKDFGEFRLVLLANEPPAAVRIGAPPLAQNP